MNRHIARFSIVALGATLLSTSTFMLLDTHKHDVAQYIAGQDQDLKLFLKIELEVEPWTQQEADCICADETETHKQGKTAEKGAGKIPCYQPSPAERMGMAARSVSL